MSSGKSHLKYETASPEDMDATSPANEKMYMFGGMSQSGHGPPPQQPPYTPSSQHHSTSDASAVHSGSPASTFTDSGMGQHHHSHYHSHTNGVNSSHAGSYDSEFAQSGLVSGSYSYLSGNPLNEIITFDSQEINIDALNSLGLPNEMMPPWLEILPSDVLGLFESGMSGTNHNHHMG